MTDILLTANLRSQGLSYAEITRLARSGDLTRVRRGAYARGTPTDPRREELHRRLILATLPQLNDGSVVSHGSAALLHGLPLWSTAYALPHVTRNRSGNGKRRELVHVHGAPLDDDEVCLIDGIPVTSLARTVLDLARTLPMEQAVAAGDRALVLGLTPDALARGQLRMERWPGIRQARRAVAFLSPLSESAGESFSRVRIYADNLPVPELQREIVGPDGEVIARVDFYWEQQRTVGEFDGKIKYGRLLRPGQSPEDAVFEEKRREDRLRDLDLQVVRWVWSDLNQPDVLAERLRRAFNRSRRSAVEIDHAP